MSYNVLEPCPLLSILSFSLGPDRIYVNWTEIQGECKKGLLLVTRYIFINYTTMVLWTASEQINVTAQQLLILSKMLSHGIKYNFTVAGINGAGFGGKSLWNVQNLGKVSKY